MPKAEDPIKEEVDRTPFEKLAEVRAGAISILAKEVYIQDGYVSMQYLLRLTVYPRVEIDQYLREDGYIESSPDRYTRLDE